MLKKINSILSKKEKISLIGMFFLMLISAILDLLGVSIILPIVSLISDSGNAIESSTFLSILSNVFNTTDVDKLFVLSLGTLVALFLIKALYGVFYTYINNKFSLHYCKNLSKKLMDSYLSKDYEYHLENDSSTLMRKSIYDVDNFIITINDLLGLIIKSLTILVIVIYLITINYQISLITIAFLVLFSAMVLLIVRPSSKRISKRVQALNSDNYKYLLQSFNGVKENKINNKQHEFSEVFTENRIKINDSLLKRYVINSIPKNTIEFVGMFALSFSLGFIKMSGDISNVAIIQTFAVFTYAVIKMLPMVITSTGILNNFTYYRTSLDTIYDDLQGSNFNNINNNKNNSSDHNNHNDNVSFNKEIKLNNVSFAYRSAPNNVVLKDVTISVPKGSVTAIVGPSGSGKTTLVDVLLGLLKPTSGEVLIDNKNIQDCLEGYWDNISYVPQNVYLTDDTIKRNIAFGEFSDEHIDNERIFKSLKDARLDDFVSSLEQKENTVVGERGIRLSGGQKQRIALARAFYKDGSVLVLDEATSSLDYETEKEIFNQIIENKKDKTIILITHRDTSLKLCDQIYKFENNELVKQK